VGSATADCRSRRDLATIKLPTTPADNDIATIIASRVLAPGTT
jgi:hypothetical protein